MSKVPKYCYVNLFMAAGLLFFPLSCAKQEDGLDGEDNVPITLYESMSNTKTILSDTDLPDSYTIYASAYFTNLTEKEHCGNYFVARPFRKYNSLWSSIPAVYWPIGGKLDFLFIASEDSAIDIGSCAVWSEGNCTKGVVADIPDGDCLESEILFATTLNRKSENGSVPVRFNHAQSWIQFVISGDASDILRIDRIVIENVYAGGTLRVSNDIYPDAEWSFRGHHRSDRIVPESEGIVVAADAPSVCGILLPEQESCDISLYYSIRSSAQEDWSTATNSVFHYKAGANPWFYGEKTIYAIGLSLQKITFNLSIEKWGSDEKEISLTNKQ